MKHFVIILLSCLIIGCDDNKSKEVIKTATSKINIDTTEFSLSYLEPIHKRKNFKTYDASLFSYINSNPNKPDSIRKIIYLMPLGNMSPKIEEIIKNEAEYLKVFFQLEVKVLARIPFNEIKNQKVKTRFVPSNDYDYYSKTKEGSGDLTEQIEANSLINNYIKEIVPDSAIAVLGITEHDLYIPKMNYIFGTSYLKDRIGLISTFRIAENSFESKSNIRKVTTKQIANLFSISNVKDYYCVLNFHNHIDGLRNGVTYISPKALEKLKYSIGFNYDKRFTELKDYHHWEKNVSMEHYYDECIKLKPNIKQPTKSDTK